MQPAAGAPRLSSAGGALLRELQVVDECGERRTVQVPIERPLTIFINGEELVTLMTLGARPEWLALGYLRNQRIVEHVTQIESIDADLNAGSAVVLLRAAVAPSAGGAQKTGMACGLGSVLSDWMRDQARLPAQKSLLRLSRSTLLRILEITREHDAVHRTAGSVHGCALFHGADLLLSIEDISRHNGLDTVAGWMLLHGVEGADKILFTTGRLTAEMVMKAAHNDISILVSRNGVSSMGCELAAKLGLLLIGRAAKGRYLCYTGFGRFDGGE